MEIITTEVFPIEKSMTGKNSVYIDCVDLNRRAGYGVCLFTIRAFNQGKLDSENSCHTSINNGTCHALRLQRQEQEAKNSAALLVPHRQVVGRVCEGPK